MFTSILAAMGLTTSLVLAPVLGSADPLGSEQLSVDVLTANGSGCPDGSVAVATAPDDTAFSVSFDTYLAQTGPDTLPTDFRRSCSLTLLIQAPPGITYAITAADYHGLAHLERGAMGVHRANYYSAGAPSVAYAVHSFAGPLDGAWTARSVTDQAALVFAPCGEQRAITFSTEVRVNAGSSAPTTASHLSMEGVGESTSAVYHLTWKRCP